MDWLKELLKKFGVEESKLDDAVGDFNKESPKHFVPKSQYNDLSEAKKKLETDLTDRDKQLETLSKTAGASEDLKKQIETLQTENKAAKEKYEADAKELQLNTALKLALGSKVHDPDIVAGLISKDNIELDENGNIKAGLDDQIKALQTSKAFLFVPESGGGNGGFQFRGAKPPEGGGAGGGGNGDKSAEFGKRVAEFAKQGNVSTDSNPYFT